MTKDISREGRGTVRCSSESQVLETSGWLDKGGDESTVGSIFRILGQN